MKVIRNRRRAASSAITSAGRGTQPNRMPGVVPSASASRINVRIVICDWPDSASLTAEALNPDRRASLACVIWRYSRYQMMRRASPFASSASEAGSMAPWLLNIASSPLPSA